MFRQDQDLKAIENGLNTDFYLDTEISSLDSRLFLIRNVND